MMTGAEITPTKSSTSSAIHSGRGCRDAGGVPSASCSARRPATKLSRRSDRRSEAGRFTSAATNRWMTSPGCSTAISGVGSITTAGTTSRLSTRPCATSTVFWRDGRIGNSSPCDGHRRQTAHWIARVARRQPSLFAHWGLLQGRRMRRESHVRFCERAGVRLPCATHLVIGCQHEGDGKWLLAELRDRLSEFGLSVHEGKTRLIEFGRFAAGSRSAAGQRRPETFSFLGFTHYCGKTRSGKFVVKRKTQVKRMVRKLKEIREEMRRRMHAPF